MRQGLLVLGSPCPAAQPLQERAGLGKLPGTLGAASPKDGEGGFCPSQTPPSPQPAVPGREGRVLPFSASPRDSLFFSPVQTSSLSLWVCRLARNKPLILGAEGGSSAEAADVNADSGRWAPG